MPLRAYYAGLDADGNSTFQIEIGETENVSRALESEGCKHWKIKGNSLIVTNKSEALKITWMTKTSDSLCN